MCCDELAVAATGRRVEYVRTLEWVARGRTAPTSLLLVATLGGRKMALLDRVRYLLGLQSQQSPTAWWPAAMAALLLPLALWLALGANVSQSRPTDVAAEDPSMTPAVQQAIQQGLAYLASRQREDGSYATGTGQHKVGLTALAGLAFMAEGSAPAEGAYKAQLGRCVDYLLASSRPNGLLACDGDGGPMYGHAFATRLLSDCLARSPRPEMREKLAKAVQLIVETQNDQGGWRYVPRKDGGADISVTVCQIMALAAARSAGLDVPQQTLDRAAAYVKQCQVADGGFMYMLNAGQSAFPRSAAAVAALSTIGLVKDEAAVDGRKYLLQFLPGKDSPRPKPEGFYAYGYFYAAQAARIAGGEFWRRWYVPMCDDLVSRQAKDGSWASAIGAECDTAMALVAMQMPTARVTVLKAPAKPEGAR